MLLGLLLVGGMTGGFGQGQKKKRKKKAKSKDNPFDPFGDFGF